jgi:hypothetical protein
MVETTGQCQRCSQPMGIARITGRKVCGSCNKAINAWIDHFKSNATSLLSAGAPVGPHWDNLIAELHHNRIPILQAFSALESESMRFLERYVAFVFADGFISSEELRAFHGYANSLMMTAQIVEPLWSQLNRGALLSNIRSGNLPKLRPVGIYLDIDEICYLDNGADYLRFLKSGTRVITGRLLVTSKKFRFLGHEASWELAWPKILNVTSQSGYQIYVQASQAKGTGVYRVPDPEYVSTVIDTVARIQRREILGSPGRRDTAKISQHIKSEVWRRDQARCAECRSTSYLEFDHIIPRSKGGATSVGNLQLLCRACNLRKSDRI